MKQLKNKEIESRLRECLSSFKECNVPNTDIWKYNKAKEDFYILNNPCVEFLPKENCWINNTVPFDRIGFETEQEAELLGVLYKMHPNLSIEDLRRMVALNCSLLGFEGTEKFIGK